MNPRSPSPRRAKSSRSTASPRSSEPGERLQKVLASAGVASRRQCEELILAGRVEVDRKVVTRLGTRVDPVQQEIRVDGTPLRRPRRLYYLLNKPAGVVSTNRDPAGRQRVIDLVPGDERLFTVGRLDRASEGLILVTNDGELANRLTHPRYEITKTYRVRVAGQPSASELQKLRKGVHLAEGVARVASLRVKGRHTGTTDLEIVLNEGRNREIRRVLARIGHKVLQLRRTAMGPLRLGRLAPGQWRLLKADEVRQLRRLLNEGTTAPQRGAGQGGSRKRTSGAKPKASDRPQRRRRTATASGTKTGPRSSSRRKTASSAGRGRNTGSKSRTIRKRSK